VFKEAKVGNLVRYNDAMPAYKGQVLTASLEIFGQHFTLLNGGPKFKFTEAISFVVHCQSQEEVDYYWEKLADGGQESMCGWLKDRFGLSWQIVPDALVRMLSDKDPAKATRVMQAMLQMKKIHIPTLEEAYNTDAALAN
jgi:predicted 3-demethylubiquinone-9 3-methyltransferase (glyoxalase superfamily)